MAERFWQVGILDRGGRVSGKRVTFAGHQMGAIVEALQRVADITGEMPTVIGGLAVLARLSTPYRATTDLDIAVRASRGLVRMMTARFAEPGPLIAMKLQTLMDRSSEKQGTDLQDIVRLMLDSETRTVALEQLSKCEPAMITDIRLHVDLWLGERSSRSLSRIHATGGSDIGQDDVELVRELLSDTW